MVVELLYKELHQFYISRFVFRSWGVSLGSGVEFIRPLQPTTQAARY